MKRRFMHWLILGLALCPGLAPAHEARESSIALRVEPDGLELVVTLSLPAAAELLGKKNGAGLQADTFDSHQGDLLAAAGRVCALSSGDVTLTPARVLVSKNHDSEVEFLFCHPHPLPRAMVLQVLFLEQLPAGYFCEVYDRMTPGRATAKRTVLLRGRSRYAVTFPASAARANR